MLHSEKNFPAAPVKSWSTARFFARFLKTMGRPWVICTTAVGLMITGLVFGEDETQKGGISEVHESLLGKATLVGNEGCYSCHQDKAATYHQTAHSATSSLPSKDSIHGSFDPGSNILRTGNPQLFFMMEKIDRDFFQTGVHRQPSSKDDTLTERFDLVIGSGRKGQTYAYWKGNQLFQLPISYWKEMGEWINSPGFADGAAHFFRPILPRCLECHTSSFTAASPVNNQYDKKSLVLGISCEKCHGPGSDHVARHQSLTPAKSPHIPDIINPARLARERQMDACALCHAGIGKSTQPPLSYGAGAVLSRYLEFPAPEKNARLDVHSSQVQLLQESRCFQSSPAMTCSTCHDVHKPQRDNTAFAKNCLTCHTVENCGKFPEQGSQIANQCVSCHMPLQETDQIVISTLNGRSLKPKVRNHQIGIYPNP